MDYVAAIDQGTTSSRCLIFDRDARIVGDGQLEHRQLLPRPGWVEHDPTEIWERTREAVQRALARGGITGQDVVALGITNQRETTVVWDRRSGRPLHRAIVWQDTRTAELCEQLGATDGPDRFRAATGLPLSTYFSGPKLRWLLDSVDGLRRAAESGEALFGTIDSWLVWNLTGGPDGGRHATDVTNASRTQLMNLRTLDWDDSILAALDIPRAMLPEIRSSSDDRSFGSTTAAGPLGSVVPITGVLGDQQAALFGQACFDPGDAKNTYGTGCFLLLHTGTEPVASRHGLLTTVAYRLGEEAPVYALEGSVAMAGAVVQWLRDNLGLIESSAAVERLAATVEDNGGVYFVPAFSGLFAPHWRADARGVIVGMTRHTNRGHIARAALEATAFQTRELLEAMRRDAASDLRALKVDGGMVVNDALLQFQADILGIPVIRPRVHETTALGAAYAAGLAIGYWSGIDVLRDNWAVDRRFEPRMDGHERERRFGTWRKAVERSLNWVEPHG